MDWSGPRAVLARHREHLFRKANVVGCGIAHKRVCGQPTLEACVCIFVRRKLPPTALRTFDLVPERLDGIRTDVVEVGDLRLLGAPLPLQVGAVQESDRTVRQRPAQPGVSVAHYLVTAGTLGAVAQDRQTGQLLILSNNHVLANSSNGRDGRAAPGDPILQPGPYDGGQTPADVIARLERFVPLNGTGRSGGNEVDAAVGAVLSKDLVSPEILGLGRLKGVTTPRVGLPVRMSGRSSGVRTGSVVALEVTADVGMATGVTTRFVNQVATSPLAQPGDSGSLVVDPDIRGVGLLFAGSSLMSLANPIGPVLDSLGITLL